MTFGDAAALGPEDLPCACLRTSRDGAITYANTYFLTQFGWDQAALEGMGIAALFSRASQAFCDSYVYPRAIAEPTCAEVQLTMLTRDGTRRPVVASVRRMPDGGFAWVMIEADNRDSLFRELSRAREALQDQNERFDALSRTDPLTGVLNRRGVDAGIRQAFHEADRDGTPVSVALLDIDQFKELNDRFGHQRGDDALVVLADALTSVCRDQDLVGRFGGDEFVCVLPRTQVEAARTLCARIHAAVAERSAALGGFTVSIGVAGRSGPTATAWSHVLSQADAALYAAKAAGRNTTHIRQGG